MGRTNRTFVTATPARLRSVPVGSATGRGGRDDRLNPSTRVPNRAFRGAEYGRFAAEVRRDLDPRGPLEDLVARHAIRSAWRLKVDLERTSAAGDLGDGIVGDDAACSLEVAIATLDKLQGRRIDTSAPGPNANDPAVVAGASEAGPSTWVGDIDPAGLVDQSNEWPVVPASGAAAPPEDTVPTWSDRLVFDFDVSDRSPVVKGTWITVSYVVSLIVDGASWSEILRTHPELTEADLRTCVAYAVAEEDPYS